MACTVGCRSSRAELVGRSYGLGPYAIPSKKLGLEINEMVEKVKKLVGVKESDTGLHTAFRVWLNSYYQTDL